MTSLPRVLSDRYELGETLGFGGMSEVHYARDLLLHRDVAIKVLRADLARDPSFYLRFRREAQNAAKLTHPTIVQVFDTGETETEDGPLPFIVMEYVDGETLRDVLRSHGPVSPRQAMTWLADVAAAMDFSHRKGIVHRDMKPANVMIDSTGAVKVMDFGIARAINDSSATMTQTSAVMGTAQYLSPEQARGIKVDPRSDIYSMGCVLFELLTGEPPFTGDSPVAVAHQHVHEEPRRPSALRKEIPPELDSIVMKAMSKNPANRYQTAADLRSDLIKVLAGGKPAAPMLLTDEERSAMLDSGPRRPVRSEDHDDDDYDERVPLLARRRRLLAVISMAVIAVLVGVLVLFQVAPWQSDTAPQVAIPQVTGMPIDIAQSTLEDAGLDVTVSEEPSLDVAEGNATRTVPGAGIGVAQGSQVTLYSSSGPPRQEMPDLRGKTLTAAKQELAILGFTDIRDDRIESSADLRDKVVSTSPRAGVEGPVDSPVVINIGDGPREITLPDVVNQMESAAREALEESGLEVTVTAVDSSRPQGTVLSMAPQAGSSVVVGSTVTLTVSRGNQFQMPDLRGMTVAQARTALGRAGWTDSTINQTERNVPLGSPDDRRILDQDPAAGASIAKDSPIDLTIGRASILPG